MRVKTISRNTSNQIQQASQLRHAKIAIVHAQLSRLYRWQKEFESEIHEHKYLGPDPSNPQREEDRLRLERV